MNLSILRMSNNETKNNKYNKIKENINSFHQAINSDIMFFKEETLEDINEFEKKIIKENKEMNKSINDKILLYDIELNDLKNKYNELVKIRNENKYLKDHMDIWEIFKKDILNITTSNSVKINLLERDSNDNISRINKLLNNSILYPRIIGINSKFKTFHEYIDYTLTQLSTTDSFINKIELDFKSFKTKIDKIIQILKIKIETSINAAHQLVQKGIKENENIIKEYINSKIFDIQIKNKELESKIENLDKKINISNDIINKKINEEIINIKKEVQLIYKGIGKYQNDNEDLKRRITKLEKAFGDIEKNKFIFNKNKNDIKEELNNLIENDKFFQNINNSNNSYKIKESLINKDKGKRSTSEHKNKKDIENSFDINKMKKKPLSGKLLENKFIKNYSLNNINHSDIINSKKIHIESNNKKYRKELSNLNNSKDNNKRIHNLYINKERNLKINERIKKNSLLINEIINDQYLLSNYKNNGNTNSDSNLINIKNYYKDSKKIKLKEKLKSLMKLNLNLKDINAQFNSNFILKKSNSNEDWNEISLGDKNYKKFPFTSRNNNLNFNNGKMKELFNYTNKTEEKKYNKYTKKLKIS